MIIGGEDRTVHFGMNTWIELTQLRGIPMSELSTVLSSLGDGGGSGAEVRDLVWASLKCGALKDRKVFEYTNYDVGFWMDEMNSDELTAFFKELGESMKSRFPVQKDAKKKVTK